MSRPLVFEIGVEELPASYERAAREALGELVAPALEQARLSHGEVRAYSTPRRLAVLVDDLADQQRDLSETVTGPPEAAAFEEDGTPKKPAIGFAKKLGLEVDALTIVSTDKGDYVAGTREEKGRPARDVLPELLASIVGRIPFRKSMRWGDGVHSFGRPIHWILCVHGEDVVPVEYAAVTAGAETRGHRFLSPDAFALKSAGEYLDRLREARVLADPAERERVMIERLEAAAKEAGGEMVPDDFLVAENLGMVEEPHVICGSFDEAFLELPDEVTIEVMRGHQRYFALRDAGGELLNRYLAVINTDRAPEIITAGNDRVLEARLADGRFFVEEDLETGLTNMAPKLDDVVFQAKLGSVGERANRLARGVEALGDAGPGVEAARLCKADLVSLIVGEFPELQGAMGRWYAEREGLSPEVARAIEEHYLPRGAGDALPSDVTSARLAVVERADALVGCFGLGMVPTGSADPFALRRAALGMIRVALEGPIDVDVRAVLAQAHAAYLAQDKPLESEDVVLASLDEFFRGRLRSWFGDRYPTDVVEACLAAWGGGSLRDLGARLSALDAFRQLPAFESLAVAFKRAHNIGKDAPDEAPFDPALATEDFEKALAERWDEVAATIAELTAAGSYQEALTLVAERLREPIDRFFDEVYVMVEDAKVRDNRLRLLGSIARTLSAIAHFHLLGGTKR